MSRIHGGLNTVTGASTSNSASYRPPSVSIGHAAGCSLWGKTASPPRGAPAGPEFASIPNDPENLRRTTAHSNHASPPRPGGKSRCQQPLAARRPWIIAALALLSGHALLAAPTVDAVPGWVAPAAGDHPRLFFRQADIPALQARAQTPEGQAIVARLRKSLGSNGTAPMPTAPAATPPNRS